jgi:tetratricopeptide (TPR) repeat protein
MITVRSLAALLAIAVALPARPLRAQCPDGTPPPCARPGAARPVAADPHRIAIFPFRVTAADTLLGDGMAELLAGEFTGESGPRAVHMGSVVRAWRLAGGSVAAPVTQAAAIRAARQLGAGWYVDGSVVGLGSRITVSASVVSVPAGRVRRAQPIRGSADSLDVLMGRLTATLLALAGGESREGSRGTLTSSPAAMRAYLEGMASWRRGLQEPASAAFERALGDDSTFARAALMRYWTASWRNERSLDRWAHAVFALRARLSSADRLLVQAILGEHYPAPRMPEESFADRARAAALLPESPEAQYLAGDFLFHHGGAIDAADALERARGYFARSFALDSQETVLSHLVEAAAMLGDTAVLRSLEPALEARSADLVASNWAAAGLLDDRAWLGRMRASHARSPFGVSVETQALLPAAIAEEAVAGFSADSARAQQLSLVVGYAQGRPSTVRRATGTRLQPALLGLTVFSSLVGEADSETGAAAARQLEGATGLDAINAAVRDCLVATWHLWRNDGVDPPPAPPGNDRVLALATMVELLRASRSNAPDLAARLESADSLLRSRLEYQFVGFEFVILAHVWEAQGNRPRALAALRMHPIDLAPFGVGARLREEGRLAAALGQSDRAIEAYRRYLAMRQDAEPPYDGERDSVRAVMTRLIRQ